MAKIMSTMLLMTGSLMAQEAPRVDRTPHVDSAPFIAPAQEPPHLMAPVDSPAYRIELPPTIEPSNSSAKTETATDNQVPPEQIGYVLPAPTGILASAPWQPVEAGGSVCRVELTSKGAKGLRVQLSGFFGTDGLQLRVYEPGGTAVLGPYSSPRLSSDKTWWTPTIFGESMGLEFYAPTSAAASSRLPQISAVAYQYKGLDVTSLNNTTSALEPTQLGCHLDVSCRPDWAFEAAGVALISFVSGGSMAACSGAMLNRSANDFSPLFLTANHCIRFQDQANTVNAFWFYQTPTCGGIPPNPNMLPQTLGSLLLTAVGIDDTVILGLYTPPPSGVNYLAWAVSGPGYGDAITGIHHPRGSFKRISFGTLTDSGIRSYRDPQLGEIEASVWIVNYTQGTTERGSSGSPLFDSAKRIRGVLTGGQTQCPPAEVGYGRFDLAFRLFHFLLDDIPSPIYVDPANTQGPRTGTPSEPVTAIYPATFLVRSGDQILIKAGNYPETFTLFRPMTLKSQGGVVQIGR
jgi:hypothetical protein